MAPPPSSDPWTFASGGDIPGSPPGEGKECPPTACRCVLPLREGVSPAGYLTMFRFGFINSRNSIRVDSRVRNTPSIAEVTAFAFCFSTPRIIMHR